MHHINTEKMKAPVIDNSEKNSRRKWLFGLSALSLFPLLKFGFFRKKNTVISCAPAAEKKTMKLLTQDGRLVEVDMANISSAKQKITDKELQGWVKKS